MEAEQKIYQLEGNYLTETPLGNIVKGWGDIDANQKQLVRSRIADDKERIFSASSHQNYSESRSSMSEVIVSSSAPQKKKMRKSNGGGARPEKDSAKFRKMLLDDSDDGIMPFDNAQLEMAVLDDIY